MDEQILTKFGIVRGSKLQEAGEEYIMRSFIMYTLPNIIRVIKLRKMRWMGHVPCVGHVINA
jgi:hypothetical protein